MKKMIKIQGYQCPFCGFANTDCKKMENHMRSCRKNSDYTQKCIQCPCLEKDWLTRKVYDGKSICCYDADTCPYANHSDNEIENEINMHKEEIKKYGY